MINAFADFHPVVGFVYFTLVIGLAMFIMHPLALGISLVCAVIYSLQIRRPPRAYLIPMLLLTAALNPLFNHRGMTILAFLPTGNATLEAVLYGAAAAAMLITVLTWFSGFGAVITAEKFIYLFGKIIPALSLVLVLVLQFIPRFKRQLAAVIAAQRGLGQKINIRLGVKILSIMVTWSLENGIETADSMKARGYGLQCRRTSYTIFRFTRRDGFALGFILVCAAGIAAGALSGAFSFNFFPAIDGEWSAAAFLAHFALFALGIFPAVINVKEEIIWRRIESKI